MKNDYNKNTFKIMKTKFSNMYYIYINHTWICIDKSSFMVIYKSYKKIYYENIRDHDKVITYEYEDIISYHMSCYDYEHKLLESSTKIFLSKNCINHS